MSKVVIGLSMSVDGIAGVGMRDDMWEVHEDILGWVFPLASWRAAQGMEGGEDSAESQLWEADNRRWGAQVIGGGTYEFSHPFWGENPPFHVPVFINTRRMSTRPIEKLGGTTYHFAQGGIEATVAEAKDAAGSRDVLIAGGVETARLALGAGVVDELALHIAPVLIGSGNRFIDAIDDKTTLRRTRLVEGSGATHVSYDIVR